MLRDKSLKNKKRRRETLRKTKNNQSMTISQQRVRVLLLRLRPSSKSERTLKSNWVMQSIKQSKRVQTFWMLVWSFWEAKSMRRKVITVTLDMTSPQRLRKSLLLRSWKSRNRSPKRPKSWVTISRTLKSSEWTCWTRACRSSKTPIQNSKKNSSPHNLLSPQQPSPLSMNNHKSLLPI